MHFDKVYNDVQLVCPGKLVFKKVRLHGSHWQKALFSYGCSTEIEEPSQQSAFSFHTVQTDLACENGLAFHTEILHHQLCVFWILDAQELWALDEQLKHFADMLAHIPTVDSGMKFSQQVQDSSLQTHNNQNVLRSS